MTIYPVFIPHAGCPQRCLFCAQRQPSGRIDVPDPAAVKDQLERLLPERGEGEVAFYGGSFSLLPVGLCKAYLEAVQPFADAGRISGIRVSTRPDGLGEEQLRWLKSGGVRTIEIGCQSFSDAVLSRTRRGHDAAASRDAVIRCHTAGFRVGLQLMPGLPGGGRDEAHSSLAAAIELAPHFLRIYPAVVLSGTGLASLWQRGEYRPWSLDAAVETGADMLCQARRAGIPVIRLGLQYDRYLASNCLAGPLHPAFGQLVRARLWRRALQQAVDSTAKLGVHPDDYSDAIGHRGDNRAWLQRICPDVTLQIDKAAKRGTLRKADGMIVVDGLH